MTPERSGSRGAGAAPSLFDAAIEGELARRAPLAARMRPSSLDEVVGQSHLLAPGAPLRALIDEDRLSSAVFFGPPGSGKTTVARLIATATSKELVQLSAVSAGVKDVREVLDTARTRLGASGRGTILFLDEIHRFSRSQQDALLPGVEDGTVVLVGATTENPFFALNGPLLSRSTLWRFVPLDRDELAILARRALELEAMVMEPAALEASAELAEGDGRSLLTTIEVAAAIASVRTERARRDGPAAPLPAGAGATGPARSAAVSTTATAPSAAGPVAITVADVEASRTTRSLRHGRDEHYDLISALIKSLRGSDPDAGVYWLARLLEAGEDPRFVARRLVILASEDVGMADPLALLVAEAAARAVDRIGLPEASLNLAQAVVHLATAPKSNASAAALWRAEGDVRDRPAGAVPAELRDSHYPGAAKLGHGIGYEYPHDDERGWVPAHYLPAELVGSRYYEPSAHGAERAIGERLAELRRVRDEATAGPAGGDSSAAARDMQASRGEKR